MHQNKKLPVLIKYFGSHKIDNKKKDKMKKHICYFLFALTLLATSCSKNDGPVPKNVNLERVPEPQVVKNGGSQAIDVTNLSSFQGKFDVGVYFSSDVKPLKYDVIIRKNGDNSTVKVFKADVTVFPTTLTISSADLASLFGTAVILGDSYDISVDVYTQSGKKYEAFPTIGAGYGSGIVSQPNASTSIIYKAICQYNPDVYQGNFVVLEDEFADLAPGDIVVLTKIDDTHFSYIYPSGFNPIPIIVTVDPLTNSLTINKQKFGDYFTWQPGYTKPNAEASGNNLNFVSPCDEEWGAVINYTVDQGGFGGYYLHMKKQ